MSVTITKNFWNADASQYDAIAKIVFTSPNIDSPASAGTRSYILPGSDYIGTWYESVAQMHRLMWDQAVPNKQEAYFHKFYINQQDDFNFNTDTTLSVRTPFQTIFSSGQVVSYNRDEYCTITTTTSGGTVSFGGEDLGTFYNAFPLGGPSYCDGVHIYRAKVDSNKIYRYDIANNFWEEFALAPDLFTVNSSITKIGNDLYVIKGSTNVFWRYNITLDAWYTLKAVPTTVDAYTYINSFNGTSILFMKAGNGSGQIIYEYDILFNNWNLFFIPSLAGYDQVWYGPALFKYDSKYYTFGCTRLGTDVDVRYIELDVGGLSTTAVGQSMVNYSTGGGGVGDVYMYGGAITDIAATVSGTDINKTLCHYYIDLQPIEKIGFAYAVHYDPGYDISGIMVMPSSGTDYIKCFDADNLSFSPLDTIKPDVASICDDGTYFYISERKATSSGTYLYRYDALVSGTSDYDTVSCDTTHSFLAGETNFNTQVSNIHYFNDYLYMLEGQYSNSLWTVHSVSGTMDNTFSYSVPSSSGTDRSFVNQPYSCICDNSTDLYVLKGKDYDSFYKYSVVSGTWTQLADAPGIMSEYGSMEYVSPVNSIYTIQGKDSNALWRYDIPSNTWYVRTGSPSSFNDKCVLHYPIYGGDYVYAIKGENFNNFWRYSIVSNTWDSLTNLITYNTLATGLTSRGTGTVDGKLYSINNTTVYEYTVNTNTWLAVDGAISYLDTDKKFTSNGNNGNIFILGNDGIRSYEIDDLSDAGSQYAYDLTFSSVIGTSVVGTDESFYSWRDGITNNNVWSSSTTSIIFEVTVGEAYDCRLTAWDDETHTTTTNKILDEEHYKVVCAAYKAYSGTKIAPESDDGTDVMAHPAGVDIPLKGNVKYYGDFDLIHVADGGLTGNEHGEYLIFTPRLHNMDSSFTPGNYDFVTTLHYQYT